MAPQPAGVEGQPEVFARKAERVVRYHHRPLARRMMSLLPPLPSEGTILDIGTGPGLLALELARGLPQARIIGLDLSRAMLEAARRTAEGKGASLEWRQAYAEQLPLPSESIDAVVSNESLHEWERPMHALDEVFRVLKRGGRLVLSDIDGAYRWWRARWIWLLILLYMGRHMASGFWASYRGSYTLEQAMDMCMETGFGQVTGERIGHDILICAQKG